MVPPMGLVVLAAAVLVVSLEGQTVGLAALTLAVVAVAALTIFLDRALAAAAL